MREYWTSQLEVQYDKINRLIREGIACRSLLSLFCEKSKRDRLNGRSTTPSSPG